MGLINYDDQRLRFLVILGNELLRLGQEVDLAGSGEVHYFICGGDILYLIVSDEIFF